MKGIKMKIRKVMFAVAALSMLMSGTVFASTLEQDDFGLRCLVDGARIDNNVSNQFQLKSVVRHCMNARSLDELTAGLSNAEVSWGGYASCSEYVEEATRIEADGLPLWVEWVVRQGAKENPLGASYVNVADETTPEFYGLRIWTRNMTEVFDGLTKASYTVEEFEDMLRTIGATNIKSHSEKENGSIAGIVIDDYYVETEFELDNYECSVVSYPKNSVVYVPDKTDVYIHTKGFDGL